MAAQPRTPSVREIARAPLPPSVKGGQFRQSLRHLASGVSVITTGSKPFRTGFTATSVSSLSAEPARIIVSVNRNSSSYRCIRQTGAFGVNFLAAGQEAIADRFAGRGGISGEARYDGARWQILETGTSLLTDALAALDLEVEEFIERHSHAIIIGAPVATHFGSPRDALLYWHGRYQPGLIPRD